ncbi:uncharacterized protein CIMG_06104 [Coccidioides immitis RS]|uniref:Uncharacterized protein n=4 Tax=Coccidioides immitis TaxID=5501 RepID=J3K7F4_COCIM|nr:uncharacterized protein CIMG_06104 [Coccidioides immitis RS]KMP03181.1 hypothetical protein CIRG_02873 [Coccidioides immitis RMSCC 2394]KMU79254.1 hypothetical protein CISG_07685 [Coccidioides immitis RMSCC 3703]KMU84756.1 hypothetical protein CIHG_02539 [Coccidioides immitis H538.4]TPX23553.1 hypothetical protein DIZ76_012887 [Coccidioides immitis]EAS30625.3 hypothetical protein CIMG_06104 [Coccidioides immitis RS]
MERVPSSNIPPSVRAPRLLGLHGATWLYPLKGIVYFLRHRFLWPLFHARMLPIALLSAFIYALLFFFTYLPQVAFLAIFHGWAGAWINGAFLVLGEGAAIVALLFEAFFVDETQVDIFDAVLIKTGNKDLVGTARLLHPEAPDPVNMLGKLSVGAVYAPFSFRQIVEFIVLLPLTLVPVIGAPLFLVLTGYRGGPFHHWRYFQLRDFTKSERKEFIARRKIRYTMFGTTALILQLIPFFSMFFLVTTAAGSALWAADMERRRKLLSERVVHVEEEYHDNPV